MSRIALCLALLCVSGPWARALQLGETKAQLLAKHGAPGAEDHARNLAVYFWEGWSAQLEFQDDVVRRLTYRRNWYLQEAEIASLLESNGGASHWKETSVANGLARQWSRDDGASATCARTRPVSIVFQAAGLAAAYQQGPKVVVPATPMPAYTKAPNFPQMLGTPVEPELPVADPQPPPPSPTQAPRPLPKLQAAELEPEPKTVPGLVVIEPKPEPASERKPASEPPSPLVAANDSHILGYILGSLGLLAALGGGAFYFLKRQSVPGKRPTIRVQVTTASSTALPDALPGLDSLRKDQVELLIGEIFRRAGYTIELSAALNTDDGIDLMLRRDSETTLVQARHWTSPRVTAREVREFYGAMAAGGAPHGILVTTGTFSPDAVEFAEGKGIELLDGAAISEKMAVVARPGENLCTVSSWLDNFVAHARIFDPECPVCQGSMVIRHNRATGAPSWNCRGYPRCPGRREPRLDLLPSSASH